MAGAVDRILQLIDLQWFEEEFVGSGFSSFVFVFVRGVRGQSDDLGTTRRVSLVLDLVNLASGCEAILSWHLQIHQEDVWGEHFILFDTANSVFRNLAVITKSIQTQLRDLLLFWCFLWSCLSRWGICELLDLCGEGRSYAECAFELGPATKSPTRGSVMTIEIAYRVPKANMKLNAKSIGNQIDAWLPWASARTKLAQDNR